MGFLLLGGVMLIANAVRELNEAHESMAWPTAPGRVIRSEMSITTDDHRTTSRSREPRTSSTFFEAKIEYEFEVNGVTHKGTRCTAIQDMNARRDHQETVLKKYPVDQAVKVSYKPDDPDQCVLEPGSWRGFFTKIVLGVVFTGFSSVLLWLVWKKRPPNVR
jgi:hypothetical protein